MRRILEVDALRGIFAMAIVLAHIGMMPDSRWIVTAVDMFFVLSGFFITTNVRKNGDTPGFLSIFFARRSLRIWPGYYLAMAACLVLNRVVKWDDPPNAWPFYLTFTQNVHDYFGWPAPKFSKMFLHTWTMAIEEQFYLLWPLLLFRAGRRTAYALAISFLVLPAGLRSLGYSPYLLLTRCDGLALGSLAALLLQDAEAVARHVRAYRTGFAAVGLGALLIPMLPVPGQSALDSWLFTTRASLVYLGVAGFVLCTRGHAFLAPLRWKWLCHVGDLSYGLYLYHPLVFATMPPLYQRYVMRRLGLHSTFLMNVSMIVVCFILAELSKRLLEDPIVALKGRLTYRGERPSAYRGPHAGRPEPPGLSADGRDHGGSSRATVAD